MSDGNGGSKGYFSNDDWEITCNLWPNLGLTVKDTEELLKKLLEEDKIVEREPGKYEPTESLKLSGGS